MDPVKANETLTITTKVVLPNETNNMGNLFGGQLLAGWTLVRVLHPIVYVTEQ